MGEIPPLNLKSTSHAHIKLLNHIEQNKLTVKAFTEVLVYLNREVLNEKNWQVLDQKVSGEKNVGHSKEKNTLFLRNYEGDGAKILRKSHSTF